MVKKSSDFPYLGLRPSERTMAAVQSRTDTDARIQKSTVGSRDLERYYALLPSVLPAFSEGEAFFLAGALNGSRFASPESIPGMAKDVADTLRESPNQSFDGASLLARLQSMSYAEQVAIVDAVEQVWLGAYRKSSDELRQRLRSVGLVRD